MLVKTLHSQKCEFLPSGFSSYFREEETEARRGLERKELGERPRHPDSKNRVSASSEMERRKFHKVRILRF